MKTSLIALAMASLIATSPTIAKTHHEHKKIVAFQVIKQSLLINQSDVKSIKMVTSQNKHYSVEIVLTPAASQRLARLTQANIHCKLMLTLGNRVINIATIQTKLGGRFQVSGLSKSTAKKMIKALSQPS